PSAPLFLKTGLTIAWCSAPIMLAAFAMSTFGGVVQGGLVFAPEALQPKISRLSPAQKLGQIFSLTGLSGLLKSLLPFTAIGYLGYAALQRQLGTLLLGSNIGLWGFSRFLPGVIFEVAWKSSLVLLAWAGVDYLLTWRKMESDLRMSREEMRQEMKETDGN